VGKDEKRERELKWEEKGRRLVISREDLQGLNETRDYGKLMKNMGCDRSTQKDSLIGRFDRSHDLLGPAKCVGLCPVRWRAPAATGCAGRLRVIVICRSRGLALLRLQEFIVGIHLKKI
jgi:hypothetical protein